MLSRNDILETIRMIDQQHLDIRTITMGISLLSCADRSAERACEKIYDKISRYAERLVATGEEIEREFGMSERHLNRLFKAATGWSIGQYRIQRKLHVAKTLLRGSRNSIHEISQSLRFGSIFSVIDKYLRGNPSRNFHLNSETGEISAR